MARAGQLPWSAKLGSQLGFFRSLYKLTCSDVSDITKAPEILGGRVKTLHPSVHGGKLIEMAADDKEFLPETLTLIVKILKP